MHRPGGRDGREGFQAGPGHIKEPAHHQLELPPQIRHGARGVRAQDLDRFLAGGLRYRRLILLPLWLRRLRCRFHVGSLHRRFIRHGGFVPLLPLFQPVIALQDILGQAQDGPHLLLQGRGQRLTDRRVDPRAVQVLPDASAIEMCKLAFQGRTQERFTHFELLTQSDPPGDLLVCQRQFDNGTIRRPQQELGVSGGRGPLIECFAITELLRGHMDGLAIPIDHDQANHFAFRDRGADAIGNALAPIRRQHMDGRAHDLVGQGIPTHFDHHLVGIDRQVPGRDGRRAAAFHVIDLQLAPQRGARHCLRQSLQGHIDRGHPMGAVVRCGCRPIIEVPGQIRHLRPRREAMRFHHGGIGGHFQRFTFRPVLRQIPDPI